MVAVLAREARCVMSATSSDKKGLNTIGLLGIGLVGRAVASLLVKAGYAVVGYAPSQASRDALKALGGQPAE